MMTYLTSIRTALAVSLLAMATACGGGSPANNQSTATTNVPGSQPAASANMMEPIGNGAAEALPDAALPPQAPPAANPADTTAPAAGPKEKSRGTPAPAARQPSPAPKAGPAPRTAPRNQAAARPAPTPEPAPARKATCTPEHRAMGHC